MHPGTATTIPSAAARTLLLTMLAMLASPLLFLLLYSLAGLSRYEIKYEGLKYSFDGR